MQNLVESVKNCNRFWPEKMQFEQTKKKDGLKKC